MAKPIYDQLGYAPMPEGFVDLDEPMPAVKMICPRHGVQLLETHSNMCPVCERAEST